MLVMRPGFLPWLFYAPGQYLSDQPALAGDLFVASYRIHNADGSTFVFFLQCAGNFVLQTQKSFIVLSRTKQRRKPMFVFV